MTGQPHTIRIAMWSGPRNISTAMMRAWESRGDTAVVDEPFYAHYLVETRLPHPGADEVIACHESDWRRVVEFLTGPAPSNQPIFYQKHMAHHLLPHIDRAWMNEVSNCFLIREPSEMLASLLRTLPDARLEDTGLPQQVEMFEQIAGISSIVPPVLDARDVLEDPQRVLRALCERLEVEFTQRMLRWKPGPRAADGVWARHWYENVWKSTGFEPPRAKQVELPPDKRDLLLECEQLYSTLHVHRL